MPEKPDLDRRDEPIYLVNEAARYLGVPVSTIRTWLLGQRYRTAGETRFAEPLVTPAQRKPATLSFWNLVELYVLASIRRHHGVTLPTVRRALDFVIERLGIPRPLIQPELFLTDGVNLFVDAMCMPLDGWQGGGAGQPLINVSDSGQFAIREVLTQSLKRIDPDQQGWALRLYPWMLRPDEPRHVEFDPQRAFGRLVIANTGIPTSSLVERFRAGETISHLATEYGLDVTYVEAALRWEYRGAA